MPRKVVVHIGMHKAGSSYIQRLLRENRRQLREAGVRILVNVKEDVTEFTRAVTRAKNRAPNFTPKRLLKRLERSDRIDGDRDLFLSCESLEVLRDHPEAMARLHQILEGSFDEIQYMLVLRNVFDQGNSRIQQGIKALRRTDYDRMHTVFENSGLDAKYAVFLDDTYPMAVVDFDALVKGNTPAILGDYIRDTLGAEVSLQDTTTANSSIGAQGVAIALCVNWMIREAVGRKLPLRSPNRAGISRLLSEKVREAGRDRDKFVVLGPEAQAEVVAQMRSQSERFIARFGLTEDWSTFRTKGVPRSIMLLSEMPQGEQAAIRALIADLWVQIEPLLRAEFPEARSLDPGEKVTEFLAQEGQIVGLEPAH